LRRWGGLGGAPANAFAGLVGRLLKATTAVRTQIFEEAIGEDVGEFDVPQVVGAVFHEGRDILGERPNMDSECVSPVLEIMIVRLHESDRLRGGTRCIRASISAKAASIPVGFRESVGRLRTAPAEEKWTRGGDRRIRGIGRAGLGHGYPPWLGSRPCTSVAALVWGRLLRKPGRVVVPSLLLNDYCDNTVLMTRQSLLSQKLKKRRGPPPTGKGTLIGVRLQPPELAQLDAWIAGQEGAFTRPEAMRHHLKRSLGESPAPKPTARRPAKPGSKREG
jgi:hypothetical protein